MRINQLTLNGSDGTTTIPEALEKTTLLFFMRAAQCPICIQHVRQIQKILPDLKAQNIDVILIVPEGITEAETLKKRYSLDMQVLAGDGLAHSQAGLHKVALGTLQQSGTFLVDATGEIIYTKQATLPIGNFSERELRAVLARQS